LPGAFSLGIKRSGRAEINEWDLMSWFCIKQKDGHIFVSSLLNPNREPLTYRSVTLAKTNVFTAATAVSVWIRNWKWNVSPHQLQAAEKFSRY